ncbi:DUF3887 domain-containing protein [Oceanobacillus locisalsi]|uniref:DUF3887 domain-containing protein n=1 Tax=Oceanobacillus locisalsi TaxID=546107 RepID=A0ABW3NGZ5_9BACI
MKIKLFLLAGIVLLLIPFLAACGDTDSASESDNNNNQEEASTTEADNSEENGSDNSISITSEEASETSEKFLTLVSEGNYEEAEALYDEVMETEMAAGDLEAIWNEMETEFGAFTGFDYVDEQQADAYYTFIYEGAFGDQSTVFTVSINDNHEVAGFYIRPSQE